MKKYLKEINSRWNSEINKFWKNILHTALTLGVASGGVVTVNSVFNLTSLGVAPIIFTVCGYILAICGALGLAAKLTKV